ncbi:hypothetical protein [Cognatitamlana onchidii]|uniref:hypothetical protein n=1 Tax=Cognatitamlana onchidii TaxID=2562860 RepID=UPI0010A6517D|nr:hypothetical protein [Algibacter onchidii]
MGVIDSIKDTNKKASEVGEQFLNKSYDYYKLKAFKQLVISISMLLKIIVIGGLVAIGFTFLTIALGIKVSLYLKSYVLGFTSIGIIYLVLGLIAYFLRKYITNIIVKSLSKHFFNKDESL